MSCKVKRNRHGYLALRVFWRGMRSWEGTGLEDTPENRKLVEAQAMIINASMKAGTFDYLRHFPKGNRAAALTPVEEASVIVIDTPKTIGEYYRIWIERKKPPIVRPGLARDYRDHFARYILPKFETTTWAELTPAMLDAFRAYLIDEKKLGLKSCKNIINASFRACYRDARKFDRLPEIQGAHPFADLSWPRPRIARPDPFTEEERDKILAYFRERIEDYYPFAYTMFFTGMRPSEALALRWRDIDFKRQEISISKSRYMGTESATKTAASEREIRLLPGVLSVLEEVFKRRAARLDDDGSEHVFLNENRVPLDFHTWRGKVSGRAAKSGEKSPHGVWYRALRGAGVRPRAPVRRRGFAAV